MNETNAARHPKRTSRSLAFLMKPARLACGIFVAFVVFLSAQAYLAVPQPADEDETNVATPPVEPHAVEETLIASAPPVLYDHPPAPRFIEYQIKSGDTLGRLLEVAGAHDDDINRFIACRGECRELHQLVPGTALGIRLNNAGRILSVTRELELGLEQQFHFRPDAIHVSESTMEFQVVKTFKHIVIRTGESPISAALRTGGIKESTVLRATQILEYDIDFWRNIHPNDEFEILYDQVFMGEQYVRDGQIFVLRFTNRGELHEAYLHADGSHYEPDGAAIQKQFLKAPLRYHRISSSFSNARKHPILGYTRAHKGVDYAAPRGTPVRATADGVVTKVKYNDPAAGTFLVLKHGNSFQTRYLHLSGVKKGIATGSPVTKGHTIGFVGSTGYSTGPHLHYEVIRNGRHMNPLSVPNPSVASLQNTQRDEFMADVEEYRRIMDELRGQRLVTSIVAAE